MNLPWNGFGLSQLIEDQALVRKLRLKRGLKFYMSDGAVGLHYGVFRSFDEARRWLPQSTAFEHADVIAEYVEVRTDRVFSFDYPVIFWLREAFSTGATSILDIGGSVGVHYYAYRRFMDYPDALTWQVYELPMCVAQGTELARTRTATQLSFTELLEPWRVESDVWMAAGAVEFIENNCIETLLSSAKQRPRHIMLNKMPLHDGDDYVSTQKIGTAAFVPHHVYNRKRYIADIESFGYRLIDSWEVHERAFELLGQPKLSFRPYSGLYFRAV